MNHRKAKGIIALLLASSIALTACGSNPASSGRPASSSGDASASKDGKTVVTVSVPINDRFMQQAVRAFEQAHPDIDIQVDAFAATPEGEKGVMIKKDGSKGEDDATIEKYRTSVNTAVMSGKADDLIAVQDLNYGVYADKGLLADLGPYLEKEADVPNGALNKNVLNAVRWNGHSYTLPIDFGLSLLIGNEPEITASGVSFDDKAWDWEQFFRTGGEMARASGGQLAILTAPGERDLFDSILRSSFNRYVDEAAKKASFDSASFVSLLQTIKALSDQGLIRREEGGKSEDDLFKAMNFAMPMMLVTMPSMLYGGKGKVYGIPGENGGTGFTTNLMFAMNAKSKVKDAAWQFLQFLLSDQMQSDPSMSGFALRTSSMEKSLNALKDKLANGKVRVQMRRNDGETVQPTIDDDDVATALRIAGQADTYIYLDSRIVQIASDEADAFFKGQKSAEDAAKQIQNRVTTYLNE